jgi:phage baseplate assembly protein W
MNEDPAFGYSLKLVNGDILLTGNGLQLVHGKENLLQALNLRVQTPAGSDVLNTTYGLAVTQVFTQPGTLSLIKEQIKLSLVQTLATDPRVHSVRDIIFSDDPRYIAQSPQVAVDPRLSRSWSVLVLIETLNAQTATLALNIGA